MNRWLVEGAGVPGYDGVYRGVGTYGGRPYYRLDGGDMLLYWYGAGNVWALATVLGTAPAAYSGQQFEENLPANPWVALQPLFHPPPTLSEIPLPSLSGRVMAGGVGQDGTSVYLTGPATAEVVTALGGYYMFLSLEDGTYTVMPMRAGYTYDPTYREVLMASVNVTDVDFVAVGRALAATGTILRLNGDPVAEVRRLTPAQGGGAVDASHHDSPEAHREFVAELRGGELSVEALYTQSGIALLHGQLAGREPGLWRVEYPGGDWWEAWGHCLNLGPTAPVAGALTYIATIRLSGKPLCSWEAP